MIEPRNALILFLDSYIDERGVVCCDPAALADEMLDTFPELTLVRDSLGGSA